MMHPLRAHIEAISKVTDEEFEYILSHFTTVKLKKHHLLVREGELVKCEYFVLKGCLRAYMTDEKSGKEYTYQFAAENWWISERDAFMNHTPAKTAIECLEDCELLALTFDDNAKLGRELWKFEHIRV